MPRVIKRTPEWLLPPAPGHQLFDFRGRQPSASRASHPAPLRTIARGRGSELFVASGNELRWADLVALKQEHAETGASRNGTRASRQLGKPAEEAYRILKVPGAGDITQLVVSPQKEFLAVVRSHQVYVAVLPEPKHSKETNLGPYRLKCFHLGPTTHCVEDAPIVSALWHPLGAYGCCLVTVTADAVVRLWEISKNDRSTFDQPSMALDLKKLANATSADQDVSASKFGSAKGFTPDSVELEPAAVCFGGKGTDGENPWHASTLWIATKGGDVYAVCPLLPKRFETSADWIDTLAMSVSAIQIVAEEDRSKLLLAETQSQFLKNLQDQEPLLITDEAEFTTKYIWSRPRHPGPAPKLQGPFELHEEPEEEQTLADIFVTPFDARGGTEFEDDTTLPGSASLICLLTTLSHVLITIDFEGVEAQWVPPRSTPFSTPKNRSVAYSDGYRTLTHFELIQLPWTHAMSLSSPPSITPDPANIHAFFVTDATGVHHISTTPWVTSIQGEILDAVESDVRLDVMLDGAKSLVDHPISFSNASTNEAAPVPIACVVLLDRYHPHSADLGYFVITSRACNAWAAQLDISDSDLDALGKDFVVDEFEHYTGDSREQSLILSRGPRDVYRPDPIFDQPSTLPNYIRSVTSNRKAGALLKEDVDLDNPDALKLLGDVHAHITNEVRTLSQAATSLFAQCQRLRAGLLNEIKQARQIKDTVSGLVGDDDESSGEGLQDRMTARIERAAERQKVIMERLGKLKTKLSKVSAREPSEKEELFFDEIDELDRKVVTGELDEVDGAKASGLMERVIKVTNLSAELRKQAETFADANGTAGGNSFDKRRSLRIPDGFRKQRVQVIMDALEREQVSVDRATEKFERLRAE